MFSYVKVRKSEGVYGEFKMRKWRDVLTERLKNNPKEARAYLEAALEDYQLE